MTREPKAFDITNLPELRRIAEEVAQTGEPCFLRENGKDIVVLMPTIKRTKKGKTKADFDAFLSAAGGWSDVDTDAFLKNIYESRDLPSRPPVDLEIPN